jgi:hypothetical protein
MATIKFERVERDCGYNKQTKADYAASSSRPRLIYDFHVMIDGEYRCKFVREYTGKGYHLQDADYRPIAPPLPHYATGRKVASQAQFESTIAELLEADKIPTLERMAELRDREDQEKRRKQLERRDDRRAHILAQHGVELYNALAAFRRDKAAGELLAAIDAKVAEALAYLEQQEREGVFA